MDGCLPVLPHDLSREKVLKYHPVTVYHIIRTPLLYIIRQSSSSSPSPSKPWERVSVSFSWELNQEEGHYQRGHGGSDSFCLQGNRAIQEGESGPHIECVVPRVALAFIREAPWRFRPVPGIRPPVLSPRLLQSPHEFIDITFQHSAQVRWSHRPESTPLSHDWLLNDQLHDTKPQSDGVKLRVL